MLRFVVVFDFFLFLRARTNTRTRRDGETQAPPDMSLRAAAAKSARTPQTPTTSHTCSPGPRSEREREEERGVCAVFFFDIFHPFRSKQRHVVAISPRRFPLSPRRARSREKEKRRRRGQSDPMPFRRASSTPLHKSRRFGIYPVSSSPARRPIVLYHAWSPVTRERDPNKRGESCSQLPRLLSRFSATRSPGPIVRPPAPPSPSARDGGPSR